MLPTLYMCTHTVDVTKNTFSLLCNKNCVVQLLKLKLKLKIKVVAYKLAALQMNQEEVSKCSIF